MACEFDKLKWLLVLLFIVTPSIIINKYHPNKVIFY
jgi:hypothetical protein